MSKNINKCKKDRKSYDEYRVSDYEKLCKEVNQIKQLCFLGKIEGKRVLQIYKDKVLLEDHRGIKSCRTFFELAMGHK